MGEEVLGDHFDRLAHLITSEYTVYLSSVMVEKDAANRISGKGPKVFLIQSLWSITQKPY